MPARQTILAFFAPASKPQLSMPVKTLCSFTKTPELRTGDECTVELKIDAYDIGVYDALVGRWIVPGGVRFDILVGTNSGDVVVVGQIEVKDEISWVHRIEL